MCSGDGTEQMLEETIEHLQQQLDVLTTRHQEVRDAVHECQERIWIETFNKEGRGQAHIQKEKWERLVNLIDD